MGRLREPGATSLRGRSSSLRRRALLGVRVNPRRPGGGMTLQNFPPVRSRASRSWRSTSRSKRGILRIGRSTRPSGGMTLQMGWLHGGANWHLVPRSAVSGEVRPLLSPARDGSRTGSSAERPVLSRRKVRLRVPRMEPDPMDAAGMLRRLAGDGLERPLRLRVRGGRARGGGMRSEWSSRFTRGAGRGGGFSTRRTCLTRTLTRKPDRRSTERSGKCPYLGTGAPRAPRSNRPDTRTC